MVEMVGWKVASGRGCRWLGVLEERESDDEVEREGGRRWQRGLGCAREQGSEWTKKGIGF